MQELPSTLVQHIPAEESTMSQQSFQFNPLRTKFFFLASFGR